MQKQHATPAQSGPNGAPRVVAPLVQRERSDQVAAIGLRTPWLRDLYHNLLILPWPIFLVVLAFVYLAEVFTSDRRMSLTRREHSCWWQAVTGYSLVGSTASRLKAWAWIGVGVATTVKL